MLVTLISGAILIVVTAIIAVFEFLPLSPFPNMISTLETLSDAQLMQFVFWAVPFDFFFASLLYYARALLLGGAVFFVIKAFKMVFV